MVINDAVDFNEHLIVFSVFAYEREYVFGVDFAVGGRAKDSTSILVKYEWRCPRCRNMPSTTYSLDKVSKMFDDSCIREEKCVHCGMEVWLDVLCE